MEGWGKTTIGKRVAVELEWRFLEGDDFHPPENIAKLKSGVPLTDADRYPWYAMIGKRLEEFDRANESVALAVSALRLAHRELLKQSVRNCRYIHLVAGKDLIQERLLRREQHFMPASLLDSQFDALQLPKDAWEIRVDRTPNDIVAEIVKKTMLECSR